MPSVDDRGVSATVTHALALAITAILISGLLLSANAVLADQRENAAREQLHTIGNRIASDLSRASALAQDGGNVTINSRQPGSVAGRNYQVEFLTGNDCSTDLFDTDACLRLSLQSGQPTVMVPVRNESDVTLDIQAGGRYVVTAVRNDTAPRSPEPDSYHDLDIGIGSVGSGFENGTSVNASNRRPIAGFTFTPGSPSVVSVVEFRNDTEDLDGVIDTYQWNFNANQDDTIDATGPTANYSYSSLGPGKYTVELIVTDNDGASDSVKKVVSVGGLVYNGNANAINVSPSLEDGGVEFSVSNLHGSEVEIQQVLVDPQDDSIDYLDAEDEADEVWIDGDDQTGTFDDSREIYDGGRIFDLDDDGSVARLSAGSSADVELMGFDPDSASGGKTDMSGKKVFVAMHYKVNGSFYTAQFTLNGAGSGYSPPDVDFDIDCTDKTCDFTDDSSPSSDISSWQWNITDGAGYSDGYGTQHVTGHTFPANGTYDVTLSITDNNDVTVSKTQTVQIGSLPGTVEFAVNAGGSEVTTGGVTYERDTSANPHDALYEEGFSDSTTGSTSHIPPGPKEDLYESVRYGDENYGWSGNPAAFGYDADVPNGEYLVTFEFAEILEDYEIDEGERIFDVDIEGNENISNLDVYDDVGDDQGLTVTHTAHVTDGELNIRFQPDSNIEPPMVSAVVARLVDPYAFQEDGSDRFVMEAENYHDRESGSYDDVSGPDDMSNDDWVGTNVGSSDSGTSMEDEYDNGDSSGDTKNGPRMDYYINVSGSTPTTYYVWVRMRCDGTQDQGVHVGIDGQPATYGGSRGLNSDGSTYCTNAGPWWNPNWIWVSHVDTTRATVTVNSAGQHTVNVWAYSDGVQIDKIVLTENAGYTPTGDGPSESPLG